MRSLGAGGVAALAVLTLNACSQPQPPAQQTATLSIPGYVPAQPPPPLVTGTPPAPPVGQIEVMPPYPGGGAVWRSGYWQWTGVAGANWQWVPGQYVLPPSGASRWVPGTWAHEEGRGWLWVDGHWT